MTGSLQQALTERLASPTPYPEGRFEGRGIVICAGGPRYFTCAWVLISVLRRVHRVALPIQVWHLGRGELSEEMRLLLEDMQVEVVDAEAVIARYPARISGGWPLKPYAIMHSRFREVLYLDADTVPIVDPETLFAWDIYRDNGMLMWPDIVDLKAASPIWRAVGLEPRDCTSVEAGLLAADKERAWPVLDLAVVLNEHVEEVYHAVYGDKDTFLVSALLAGRTPPMLPHRPFVFDLDLVQRDPAGEPFLQHRTGSKWNVSGGNRPLAAAHLMPHCESALAELRQRWSGEVFNAPPRTVRALAEEARLVAMREFLYEPRGADARRFELLPASRVGIGNGSFEQHWAVIERDGILVLQFYSSTRLTIELTQLEDGSWDGRGIMPATFRARMIEMAARRTWPHAEGRVAKSAAEWVTALLDVSLFAPGFDGRHAAELRAALSLLNERFDDVPEQIEARLEAVAVTDQWRRALAETIAALAACRDQRIALTVRASYPRVLNSNYYDRIP
jgi:hypothetical protein